MGKRYDVTTLEGAMAFAHDFSWAKSKQNKYNKMVFEGHVRQKRAFGFEEDEIWKGVKHHGMDRTKI